MTQIGANFIGIYITEEQFEKIMEKAGLVIRSGNTLEGTLEFNDQLCPVISGTAYMHPEDNTGTHFSVVFENNCWIDQDIHKTGPMCLCQECKKKRKKENA